MYFPDEEPVGLISEAGRLLYGKDYHRQLASALNVARRTVQRWEAGRAPIPLGAWEDLHRLVGTREQECYTLNDMIRHRILNPPESIARALCSAREQIDEQTYAEHFPPPRQDEK